LDIPEGGASARAKQRKKGIAEGDAYNSNNLLLPVSYVGVIN